MLTWRWIRRPPPGIQPNDLSVANERLCGEAAKRMMEWLIPPFEVIAPVLPYPPPWEGLTDQWDRPIWAAAVVGQAQYVISENTHHYPPRQADGRRVHQGIEYLGGRAFLDFLIQPPFR